MLLLAAAAEGGAAAHNGNTCVSNRGKPYGEDDCEWYGKGRGCVWDSDQCLCEQGGTYSKRHSGARPPGPPRTLGKSRKSLGPKTARSFGLYQQHRPESTTAARADHLSKLPSFVRSNASREASPATP